MTSRRHVGRVSTTPGSPEISLNLADAPEEFYNYQCNFCTSEAILKSTLYRGKSSGKQDHYVLSG